MTLGHKDTDGEFDSVKGRNLVAIRDPYQETVGLSYDDHAENITPVLLDRGLRVDPHEEVLITEATVSSDYSGDVDIVIREFDASEGVGELVDSSTVTLTTGVQTVGLDLTVPGDGEDYFLGPDEEIRLGYIDEFGQFPVEGDLMTIVEGATPEAFVGPRSDYHFLFDIEVEEATPGESSIGLNDDGAIQFEKTATDQQNGTYYAAPGELTSVLDSAPQGSTVSLYSGQTYTATGEITVPREVRLDGNGATITPDGDHNVFFLEPNCHLKHLNISVKDVDYTSKAIEINTERAGDSYHGGAGGTVIDDVNIRGDKDNMGGDGVYIRVGSSQWYSANQEHQFAVSGMGNGLHVDVDNGGHANGNIFRYSGWDNGTQIRHTDTGPFESQIIGELDATTDGAGTEHIIVNENNTGRTCTVYGKIYDPFNCSGSIFVGLVNIKHHSRPHVDIVPNSPEAEGLIVSQDRNELLVVDLGQGISWRRLYYSGDPWLRFQVDMDGGRDFIDIMSFRMGDGRIRMSQELVTNDLWVTGDIDLGGGAGIRTNSDGAVIIEDENGNTLSTGS